MDGCTTARVQSSGCALCGARPGRDPGRRHVRADPRSRCRSATGSASSTRMRDEVAALFGRAPRGAWLAERVWEPSLPATSPPPATNTRSSTTTTCAARSSPRTQMWGTYTTDDQGKLLTIFGTEQGLRYRIPWQPVDDADRVPARQRDRGRRARRGHGRRRREVRRLAGNVRAVLGRGGVGRALLHALEENAAWLTTVTPSTGWTRIRPSGRVYIPTASYVEMTEWALPADEQPVFNRLLEHAARRNLPEARFLRGALWRNFQARYREINDLHKQMLRVSAAVDAMPAGALRDRARRPPVPRPVERLLLARLVRRRLHRPHAHGHAGRADRGRGSRAGRRRRRSQASPTMTWTEWTKSHWERRAKR